MAETTTNYSAPNLAPCRYYQEGNCRKGDSCEFSHSTSSPDPAGYPYSSQNLQQGGSYDAHANAPAVANTSSVVADYNNNSYATSSTHAHDGDYSSSRHRDDRRRDDQGGRQHVAHVAHVTKRPCQGCDLESERPLNKHFCDKCWASRPKQAPRRPRSPSPPRRKNRSPSPPRRKNRSPSPPRRKNRSPSPVRHRNRSPLPPVQHRRRSLTPPRHRHRSRSRSRSSSRSRDSHRSDRRRRDSRSRSRDRRRPMPIRKIHPKSSEACETPGCRTYPRLGYVYCFDHGKDERETQRKERHDVDQKRPVTDRPSDRPISDNQY